ncbi:glycerate kinase [Catalinimonas alkaloidigena]|uniref:glycerate kinase n=1 Tax=Catalinimonas alkaloidigena TaxID=1075417 RepID=UPI0024074496|nr:glycerate kinase [Catalinimonas alkaloidigena]MDF9796140.1 glycerate kinase [Catalinimonas alkaloidigena]
MKVLIAPNAFKNSLDAVKSAEAIAKGLNNSKLEVECLQQPIADGGDGMLTVMLSQEGGEIRQAEVDDPLGRKVVASFGLIHDGKTAVIEMAEASGIRLLKQEELNPMKTSSVGTGQLMKAALDAGVKEIVIGLGGSATVDLGLGMAQALGVKMYDASGNSIPEGGAGVQALHEVDLKGVDSRLAGVKIVVTCDVTNKLLEAPSVFGPQKGADESMVKTLEEQFERVAYLLEKQIGRNFMFAESTGAAGGLGAALYGFFDAELVDGTNYLLSRTGFHQDLKNADLVITAEGALDKQTQAGKGPYYVASQAKTYKKPVIMLAGSLPKNYRSKDYEVYDAVFPIGPRPQLLDEALAHTAENLERTACQLGNLLALKVKK